METLSRIEQQIASWYAAAPHLPENARAWLRRNCWWMVLVLVTLAAIGILGPILLSFIFSLFTTTVGGVYGAALGGAVLVAVVLYLFGTLIGIVLGAAAVVPLMHSKRRGWVLLFIILLIWFAEAVIDFILHHGLGGFVQNVLFLAMYGYFLFEIRMYFTGPTRTAPIVSPPHDDSSVSS